MGSRDTRRRFEQWARNPACQANATSAMLGVSMADVAVREGLAPSMGQSPFAIQRGQRFERLLFRKSAEILRAELEKAGVLPKRSRGFADLRLRHLGGSCRTIEEARARTLELLGTLARNGCKKSASLAAGATICIPGRAMWPEAILVLDTLVARQRDGFVELVVGEIKTYPDRGGYTDRIELATARAQAGIYVHGLTEVVGENGWTRSIRVARTGFLVLTKPGSNRPSVRAQEDLRYQAARAARGLGSLRAMAGQVVASDTVPADPIGAVLAQPIHYEEACIRFCDRAPGCFARVLKAGEPAVLGDDASRLLGAVNLDRVRELLHGAKPRTYVERELVSLARTRRTR